MSLVYCSFSALEFLIKNFLYDNVKLHVNEFTFDLKKNLLAAKYFRADANLEQTNKQGFLVTFWIRGKIDFEILFLLKKTKQMRSLATLFNTSKTKAGF